jgi:hypothetical protein
VTRRGLGRSGNADFTAPDALCKALTRGGRHAVHNSTSTTVPPKPAGSTTARRTRQASAVRFNHAVALEATDRISDTVADLAAADPGDRVSFHPPNGQPHSSPSPARNNALSRREADGYRRPPM